MAQERTGIQPEETLPFKLLVRYAYRELDRALQAIPDLAPNPDPDNPYDPAEAVVNQKSYVQACIRKFLMGERNVLFTPEEMDAMGSGNARQKKLHQHAQTIQDTYLDQIERWETNFAQMHAQDFQGVFDPSSLVSDSVVTDNTAHVESYEGQAGELISIRSGAGTEELLQDRDVTQTEIDLGDKGKAVYTQGRGNNSYQEDRAGAFVLQTPLEDNQQARDVLASTAISFASEHFDEPSGATYVSATVTGDTVTVANLGDSVAWLVAQDAAGRWICRPMTREHEPDSDLAVIQGHGEAIEKGRLAGLKVGRSIGDASSVATPTPEMTEFSLVGLDNPQMLFMCDGFLDGGFRPKDVEHLLNTQEVPLADLPDRLRQEAYDHQVLGRSLIDKLIKAVEKPINEQIGEGLREFKGGASERTAKIEQIQSDALAKLISGEDAASRKEIILGFQAKYKFKFPGAKAQQWKAYNQFLDKLLELKSNPKTQFEAFKEIKDFLLNELNLPQEQLLAVLDAARQELSEPLTHPKVDNQTAVMVPAVEGAVGYLLDGHGGDEVSQSVHEQMEARTNEMAQCVRAGQKPGEAKLAEAHLHFTRAMSLRGADRKAAINAGRAALGTARGEFYQDGRSEAYRTLNKLRVTPYASFGELRHRARTAIVPAGAGRRVAGFLRGLATVGAAIAYPFRAAADRLLPNRAPLEEIVAKMDPANFGAPSSESMARYKATQQSYADVASKLPGIVGTAPATAAALVAASQEQTGELAEVQTQPEAEAASKQGYQVNPLFKEQEAETNFEPYALPEEEPTHGLMGKPSEDAQASSKSTTDEEAAEFDEHGCPQPEFDFSTRSSEPVVDDPDDGLGADDDDWTPPMIGGGK